MVSFLLLQHASIFFFWSHFVEYRRFHVFFFIKVRTVWGWQVRTRSHKSHNRCEPTTSLVFHTQTFAGLMQNVLNSTVNASVEAWKNVCSMLLPKRFNLTSTLPKVRVQNHSLTLTLSVKMPLFHIAQRASFSHCAVFDTSQCVQ